MALAACAPAVRSLAAKAGSSAGTATGSSSAPYRNACNPRRDDDRAVGAQFAPEAVEETEPALDDGEAVGVGERDVHRAETAHRTAHDRAGCARRDRGKHAVNQFLDFDHIARAAVYADVAPVVGAARS